MYKQLCWPKHAVSDGKKTGDRSEQTSVELVINILVVCVAGASENVKPTHTKAVVGSRTDRYYWI